MKKNQVIDLGLTGYDELFMNDQERADIRKPKVEEIPLTELTPFKDHPFKVKNDEEMTELMKSIADSGVLAPALARPKEGGGYELISGHRRLAACQALGVETMPVIIRDLTDEEAVITMVDSNLQREHILPSEKAFAYKMKLDAMSRQGYRSDLTSDQVGRKLETAEIIAQQSDDSKSQVRRYIRLTYLIPELLDWMDEGKIALSVGVELSFLSDEAQYGVLEECELYDCTPSYSQAFHMKNLYNDGNLSRYEISKMLSQEKPNQRETIKIPVERLRDIIPDGFTVKQTEDFLIKAAEYYRRYLQKQRENSR